MARSDLLHFFAAGGPGGALSLNAASQRQGSSPEEIVRATRKLMDLVSARLAHLRISVGVVVLFADEQAYESARQQADALDKPVPHFARQGGVVLRPLPAVVEMQHRTDSDRKGV